MISRPLFKQSFKANFTRWLIVTFASMFIVAAVILIIGNLSFNDIKVSLTDLFQNSADMADVKENAIDAYLDIKTICEEVYDNYTDRNETVDRILDKTATEEEIADFGDELVDSVHQLKAGEKEISDGQKKLDKAQNTLNSAKKAFNENKETYTEQLNDLKNTKKLLEGAISIGEKGIEALGNELQELRAGIEKLEGQISETEDESQKQELTNRLNTLKYTEKQLVSGIAVAEKELDEARNNLALVNDGISQIENGLSDAEKAIKKGESAISSGKKKLKDGQKELEDGYNTLEKEVRDSLRTEIPEAVYDEALKETDKETALELKALAEKIISGIDDGSIHRDNVYRVAKDYIGDRLYREVLAERGEDDADKVRTNSLNAVDTYEDKLRLGATHEEAMEVITASLIDQMPSGVSDAMAELRDLDIYSLVIGTILYRIAGLLLPVIFVVMVSNNLISGQVDSGSMAYILSTPITRKKVAFTQMVYLITSVASMYLLVGAAGITCSSLLNNPDYTLDNRMICMFTLGGFCCIFAMSGLCFMCSAIFNRSKNATSIGQGICFFFIVASLLGMFGLSVMPSIMRIKAMNYFNYFSIITLFDIDAIIANNQSYITGFIILGIIGLIGYIIGIIRFDKKDLPL